MTGFGRRRDVVARCAIGLGAAAALLLVGLPLLSLLIRVPPQEVLRRLGQPLVLDALRLSLLTSACATALVVVLGLPVSYLLALRDFPGRRMLETVVRLPMVLPPTVAGLGLLLAFGRNGLAGRGLALLGVQVPFTTLAVVLAEWFIAFPFFVGPTVAGFREIEQGYLDAAATLRSTPERTFWRVVLPLAAPSVIAGAAMSWARALGEFGATITFAGNLPGRTQTMPLAVYLALQSDLEAAIALSVLLLAVSAILLWSLGGGRLLPGARADR